MKNESPQKLIDTVDQLLDRERQALVQGNLEEISDIMNLKQNLFDQINQLDDDQHQQLETEELKSVQEKVTRNQALLSSAFEGIRAVANRMADLRRVRSGLETYDRRGQKKSFGAQSVSSVEKRA